ncbi:unnamed protein product [Gongylonema pulchrum]|uniref:Uncharacterized protein n=1 Tax=Gongylonema pulchrum TaxID=637853 RepID=A0A183E3K5_9BILA|nr:unnamed protein product [Gongylonema pulchrum]
MEMKDATANAVVRRPAASSITYQGNANEEAGTENGGSGCPGPEPTSKSQQPRKSKEPPPPPPAALANSASVPVADDNRVAAMATRPVLLQN